MFSIEFAQDGGKSPLDDLLDTRGSQEDTNALLNFLTGGDSDSDAEPTTTRRIKDEDTHLQHHLHNTQDNSLILMEEELNHTAQRSPAQQRNPYQTKLQSLRSKLDSIHKKSQTQSSFADTTHTQQQQDSYCSKLESMKMQFFVEPRLSTLQPFSTSVDSSKLPPPSSSLKSTQPKTKQELTQRVQTIKHTLSQAASHSSLKKRRRSSSHSRSIQPSPPCQQTPSTQVKTYQQTIRQLIAERKQTKLTIAELQNESSDLKLRLRDAEKRTQAAS